MSHAMTTSPKPSFTAPWRVGDAVVGIGNAEWTTSTGGYPCSCQNCSLGAVCPPPPTQLVKGLNWIVLVFLLHGHVAQSQSTSGHKKHVGSEKLWVNYSPTVNGQGLYSILPFRKYGRVTHTQSMDRVYTAFCLLESMGELLIHSQWTGFIQHFAS